MLLAIDLAFPAPDSLWGHLFPLAVVELYLAESLGYVILSKVCQLHFGIPSYVAGVLSRLPQHDPTQASLIRLLVARSPLLY